MVAGVDTETRNMLLFDLFRGARMFEFCKN